MGAIFYGVGVGPGDPELLTLKAVRVINECEILAVPGEKKEESVAYRIALSAVPSVEKKTVLGIRMPMTRDKRELAESHARGAAQIAEKLAEGKNVAFLTLGDPTVYSTFGYLRERVQAAGFETRLINGVASFLAAAARVGISLAEQAQQLHVVPFACGTDAVGEAARLGGTRVFMKAGKKLSLVKEALCGGEDAVFMVENCGMADERVYEGIESIPETAGYYSLVIVKEKT